MKLSYGFIETRGLIGAIEASDAMLKAAEVTLLKSQKIGAALVTVMVEGELGAVQAAVDAGKIAAERIGELIAAHVIANPFDDTVEQYGERGAWSEGREEAAVAGAGAGEERGAKGEGMEVDRAKISEKPSLKKDKRKKIERPLKVSKLVIHREEKSAAERLHEYMFAHPEGATLPQISENLSIETSELRILLKQLMDENRIEKVQQKYFLINSGGN